MHSASFFIKASALLGFLFTGKSVFVLFPKFQNITDNSEVQQRWKAVHHSIYFSHGPGTYYDNLVEAGGERQNLSDRTWEI